MPKLLILAGPSAVGKSYTASALVHMFPDKFAYARVHTTRVERQQENRSNERIFISDEVFQTMVQNDEFFAFESFAGYLYGYSKSQLQPRGKHVIVDVSPYLLPEFTAHNTALIIGLQAPEDYTELSEKRMQQRGDSMTIRKARRPFIERDIEALANLRPFIDQHGKFFQIQDNSTVPDQVVPWIIEHLELSH